MERFGEKEDCDPAEFAWYLKGRRVYEADSPASVHLLAPTPTQSDKS
jgi:hypothetical protein